ncbi:MAG: UPF0175 family protein, partial [Candidatus Methylomirabilis sp.]|nr:UPF0175 family protein [Deltaproteobacteria bacterium]
MAKESRKLQVTLPAEVAAAFADGDEEAGAQLRELVVVELFREDRLTLGEGARVLGLALHDFIELLGRHQVTVLAAGEE